MMFRRLVALSLPALLLSGCGGGMSGAHSSGGSVTVSVSPSPATVAVQGTEQFTATVGGTSNTMVTWTVSGAGCSAATCGTISSAGLYTAPPVVPSPATVTVTGTSQADGSASGSATVTITGLAVAVSPPTATVTAGQTQQFAASVSGTSNQSVNWTLSGAGCSGTTCGTISSAGLYTAPATVPSPATVTVTASSAADTNFSGTAAATILVAVRGMVLPPAATVALSGTQQFSAEFTPAPDVTWSLSGSGCSGAACGTISGTGLYTAPASVPSPATVTVSATSTANPGFSATAPVALVSSPNARLNGSYAFLFSGYDASGALTVGGSFVADGNGTLTSVVQDVNQTSGVLVDETVTGATYAVGPDNRGSLFLTSSLGAVIYRFILDAGGNGRFIEFDSTALRGSGFFLKQDTSAFSLANFHGSFVLALSGQIAGGPIASIGRFDGDSSGNLTNGLVDAAVPGTSYGSVTLGGSLSAIGAAGRAAMTLTTTGSVYTTTENFAVYVVSAKQGLLVELDSRGPYVPVFSGQLVAQTGAPFSNSSWSHPGVFAVAGVDPAGRAQANEVTLGQVVPDGAGGVTGVLDQNDAGTLAANASFTGSYSVASSSRGTLTLAAGLASGQDFTFYMIGPDSAVWLEGAPSTPSQSVQSGWLYPQSGGPSTNSTIGGSFAYGTTLVPTAGVRDTFGFLSLDGSGGLGAGSIQDETTPTEIPDEALTGTYTVAADGRGTFAFTATAASQPAPLSGSGVLYVISGSEFVAIPPLTSGTASPGLMFGER